MTRTRTSKPEAAPAPTPTEGTRKKGLTITLPPELGDALKAIAARTGHTIPETLKVFSDEVMVLGIGAAADRMIATNNALVEELRGMRLPGMSTAGAIHGNLRGAAADPGEDGGGGV